MRTNKLPITAPNLNGRCERFILTIKSECLQKIILFGQAHVNYIVRSFLTYYNGRRSHMEREHLPPIREKPIEILEFKRDSVEMKSYVGGLVKSFERKAA